MGSSGLASGETGRLLAFGLVFACVSLLAACGDDDSAPLAPSGGGHGSGDSGGGSMFKPPPPVLDAGADEDAGSEPEAGDGGLHPLLAECDNVDAVQVVGETMNNGELYNAIMTPADFMVTRVTSSWADGCSPPTIVIVMSGGRCPDGNGHELRFYIDADAIQGNSPDASVHIGENVLRPEPNSAGIRVRYVRPEHLTPTGEWGTCEGSEGTLSFRGDVDAMHLGHLQAQFQLTLTPCDGSDQPAQSIIGTFNANMRRDVQDVCP